MTKPERELIEAKISGIYAKIDSNHKIVSMQLDRILEQTTKTNGRVSELEDQTQFVRFFEKRPFLLGLLTVGFLIYLGITGLIIYFKI